MFLLKINGSNRKFNYSIYLNNLYFLIKNLTIWLRKMFLCPFCDHCTEIFTKHLDHHDLHRNLSRLSIVVSMVAERFKKMKRFEILRNLNGSFVSSVLICGKEYYDYQSFIKHLKEHMRVNNNVSCPVKNCDKKYCNVSSFTSHLSRYHKGSSNISARKKYQWLREQKQSIKKVLIVNTFMKLKVRRM